jgi:hypothetical protein
MNDCIKIIGYLEEKYRGEKGCNRRHDDDDDDGNDDNTKKKEGIQHIKAKLGAPLKKKWESKITLGQYIRSVERQFVGEEVTLLWLLRGDLKGESVSKLITNTRSGITNKKRTCNKNITKQTDSTCRPQTI